MTPRIGPTRLIVIRSGKFDYGEIDLTAPVHLVGPNNVGKTSLIALLQLLYIDSQQHMTFSRPMDESKRYYFPDTYSYVLFEVLTPTGFQVVGAHGLGKVNRNDFERFTYQGRFDASHYLDDERRVREAKEVKSRLALQGYKVLQPRHLRAALTGQGDGRDVHLGLVPLRHRDQYERFRAVFQHLLRLAQIRQAELKSLLLEIYRNSFRQESVDLGKEVAEQLRIVRTNQIDVQHLKALQPDVERLLKAVAARDETRGPLPGLWRQVGISASRCERDQARRIEALRIREGELTEEKQGAQAELNHCTTAHDSILKDTGRIEELLKRLDVDRKQFKGFVPEFKEQERTRVEGRIEELTVRLHAGGQETADQVERRLTRCMLQRTELGARLANLAGSVGQRMVDLLPEAERRAALFKVVDARLLQLAVGKTGLQIDDEDTLRRWLGVMQDQLVGDMFTGCGVCIDLTSLPEPDLDEYLNADRIADELASLNREIQRLEAAAQAQQDARSLARERDELMQQRNTLALELAGWGVYLQALESEPELKKDLAAAEAHAKNMSDTMSRIRSRLQEIQTEHREIESERAELQIQKTQLRAVLAKLEIPDDAWELQSTDENDAVAPPDNDEGLDFADTAARYSRLYDEQRRFDERVQDQLRRIDEHTYGRYAGTDEQDTLLKLRREMDALPEKEASTDQLWHALAVGLRTSFKQLLQDMETLKGHVATLNRQLSAVSVSNLERVRLVIEDRPEWSRRIKDMLEFEDMPLFADPAKSEAAVNEIGALLDKHEKVQLTDLFGLQFEITTVDGGSRFYKDLDSVESNGTTITMKVLINVLMLRGLLNSEDVRIPFYLDEASSLDHENLEAIVHYSLERGFVPVLASPDPMEAATHLYFVSETGGRVVLDPALSKVTLRAVGDDSAESGDEE